MGLIEWYLLFAVTTAGAASYELFWPVLSSLRITHPELPVLQHMRLTICVFFVITMVMAPIAFLPCVVPSMSERFKITLWETLIKQ